jgi:hypothetical protein
MHKLNSKLKFYEKEPADVEKIEKTLSTMLPAHMIVQQQYRQRGFTVYSELIKTLLQAARHNELLIWNSNQGPIGAKPLPEVHATTQKKPPYNANKAILEPIKAKTSTREPISLKVLRERATILSRTKISLALAPSVVVTITRLRNVAPQST